VGPGKAVASLRFGLWKPVVPKFTLPAFEQKKRPRSIGGWMSRTEMSFARRKGNTVRLRPVGQLGPGEPIIVNALHWRF
jgi:hypothetical protein